MPPDPSRAIRFLNLFLIMSSLLRCIIYGHLEPDVGFDAALLRLLSAKLGNMSGLLDVYLDREGEMGGGYNKNKCEHALLRVDQGVSRP